MDAAMAVSMFRDQLLTAGAWFPVPMPWPNGSIPSIAPTTIDDVKRELKGKNLACFCRLDQPCHADVLLGIANRDREDEDRQDE
jgi:hypothetical protein